MRGNYKFLLLVGLSVIIQAIMYTKFELLNTNMPFLDGVPLTESDYLIYRYLMLWSLPIIFLSFYFSGLVSTAIKESGAIYFTRSYSKAFWLFKRHFIIFNSTAFFVAFQFLTFTLLKQSGQIVAPKTLVIPFITYLLILVILFSMQQLMELFIKSELAHLLVNVYLILSILLATEAKKVSEYFVLILFPNLGMIFKTKESLKFGFDTYNFDNFAVIIVLLFLYSVILVTSVIRINKIDII